MCADGHEIVAAGASLEQPGSSPATHERQDAGEAQSRGQSGPTAAAAGSQLGISERLSSASPGTFKIPPMSGRPTYRVLDGDGGSIMIESKMAT